MVQGDLTDQAAEHTAKLSKTKITFKVDMDYADTHLACALTLSLTRIPDDWTLPAWILNTKFP